MEDEREKGKAIYKNRGEWELRGERRTGRGGQESEHDALVNV